jgi:hypothetical protein
MLLNCPSQGATILIRTWVYVRDDMSKGLKIMSLGVINHGMSLSVQTNFEKNDVCSSVE